MRTYVAIVALILSLPGRADTSATVLTFEGIGKVRFGMTLVAVEKVLGHKSKPGEGDPGESCEYISFGAYPHVNFMVIDGTIVRAEVTSTVGNVLGLKVGDSLGDIRKRFPNVRVTANPYDDDGHDLLFLSPDKKAALLANESKGRIVSIRSGLLPAVQYVEGCQ